MAYSACNPCNDCKPSDDEPYVNVEFFKKSNLETINVAIREFNGQAGEEIIYYQDTTSQFILPLSMSSDSSLIILTYVSSDDYDTHITDSIYISYDRIFETTPKNIVQIVTDNTRIINHSFDSLALVCKDTLGICISNESTIKAYF
jgi:hypothetical protein